MLHKITHYIFVRPEYIIGDHPQNIHIFACYFDPSAKTYTFSNLSLCRKAVLASKFSACRRAVGNTDQEAMACARLMAAELQNEGEEVCGQCIATLYSDGDGI